MITLKEMYYKQNIIFHWLEDNKILDYDKKEVVKSFCNEHGFILKWQRSKNKLDELGFQMKGCWSIGIFEDMMNEKTISKISNFAISNLTVIPKKTSKSRNDVQIKKRIAVKFRESLYLIQHQISLEKKRKQKRNPLFYYEDITKDSAYIEKLEKLYRYKLKETERKKLEDNIIEYINILPSLKGYIE